MHKTHFLTATKQGKKPPFNPVNDSKEKPKDNKNDINQGPQDEGAAISCAPCRISQQWRAPHGWHKACCSPVKPVVACPDKVTVFNQIGQTPLGDLPITVVDRDTETVTFVLTNTWTESLEFVYIEYTGLDDNKPCSKFEDVEMSASLTLTACCMMHVPVTMLQLLEFGSRMIALFFQETK
jgi:hypothetical protein